MGPRWRTRQLPLDLEPQYTLIVDISKLNDTLTGAMTVPRHWWGVVSVGVILEAVMASFKHLFKETTEIGNSNGFVEPSI